GRVIRPRVVERTTQRDGEVAIQPGPFLTGAAGKHDGLIDALEVHVLEARLRISHAGAFQTVELCRALGFLDSHTWQIGELLFDAFAPGFPLWLELAGDALLPIGQVTAVPIGIDHMSAKFTHEVSSLKRQSFPPQSRPSVFVAPMSAVPLEVEDAACQLAAPEIAECGVKIVQRI